MRKVLFLLLFLLVLGAAGISAQVRIGGDGEPNAAAVLDLNANNDATPAENKGGLALPRVELASTTAKLNGATPLSGTLVYNTKADMTGGSGIGVYFWNGTSWVAVDYDGIPRPGYNRLRKAGDFALPTYTYTHNTEHRFSAPGARNGDICRVGSSVIFFVTAGYDYLFVRMYRTDPTTTFSITVNCWRIE